MAYEHLTAYVESLATQHDNHKERMQRAMDKDNTREVQYRMGRCDATLDALCQFYTNVLLVIPTARAQRAYCMTVIRQISPARANSLTTKQPTT